MAGKSIPDRPDSVGLIVAGAAQPEKVLWHIITALTSELSVVNVDARSLLTLVARLMRVLQSEASE